MAKIADATFQGKTGTYNFGVYTTGHSFHRRWSCLYIFKAGC